MIYILTLAQSFRIKGRSRPLALSESLLKGRNMKKVVATTILATNIGVVYACVILGSVEAVPLLPAMIILMVAIYLMPASVGYFNDKMYKDHSDSKG